MTIAHDAATQSSSWTTTPDPFTFSHTPVGTPRGVIVMITINAESGLDHITGVTYGGVAMARVTNGFAQDTTTEPGSSYLYFLGSGIPTGTQTVSVDHTAAAGAKVACCATLTAAGDTVEAASGVINDDLVDPQIALNSGADVALRYVVMNTGLGDPANLTMVSGMTAMANTDHGARVSRFDRETSPSSGSTTVGYTAAVDDVAMIAAAIKEVPAAAASLPIDTPTRSVQQLLAR